MIICQTPLRISFAGGGTDIPEFYREHGGAVLTSTINKYVFIIVNDRFESGVSVNYYQNEVVSSVEELKHDLVREALLITNVRDGVNVVTMSDVPAWGSGLGSSGALTVGILNALFLYQGVQHSPEFLAEKACEIEIQRLGRPIGKQDQYACAFGNFNYITFGPDEDVKVRPVKLSEKARAGLEDSLLLVYSGIGRDAGHILREQRENIPQKAGTLEQMKGQAQEARKCLEEGRLDDLGRLLHEAWRLKKSLATVITNQVIDEVYECARSAGALGGKVLGAGGGGFLLFYCAQGTREMVRKALKDYRTLSFRFVANGSRVLFLPEEVSEKGS
ncbi:MAG: GHMP kinase [Chloroflexi bacterium]|nr:GHMP kinase [Chloroflexota bacterium]